MTGIEKLREYAENLKGTDRYDAVGMNIEALADQIERETLPRPLFEDGEPVQFGDEFVVCGEPNTVKYIEFDFDGDFALKGGYGYDRWFDASERVERPKKPEPQDSWERIEEDAQKRCCEYFNPCPGDEESEGVCVDCRCMTKGYRCNASQRLDIVRRCRALSEKEAGR